MRTENEIRNYIKIVEERVVQLREQYVKVQPCILNTEIAMKLGKEFRQWQIEINVLKWVLNE